VVGRERVSGASRSYQSDVRHAALSLLLARGASDKQGRASETGRARRNTMAGTCDPVAVAAANVDGVCVATRWACHLARLRPAAHGIRRA